MHFGIVFVDLATKLLSIILMQSRISRQIQFQEGDAGAWADHSDYSRQIYERFLREMPGKRDIKTINFTKYRHQVDFVLAVCVCVMFAGQVETYAILFLFNYMFVIQWETVWDHTIRTVQSLKWKNGLFFFWVTGNVLFTSHRKMLSTNSLTMENAYTVMHSETIKQIVTESRFKAYLLSHSATFFTVSPKNCKRINFL